MNNKKRTMHQQRNFDFEATAKTPPAQTEPHREPEQVAQDTSLPPPLVRPDRQLVYADCEPEFWPAADSLHDQETITVDRIHTDIDGPSHRFVIKRGDTVEAWFGGDNLHLRIVVAINHTRREARVEFALGATRQWLAVDCLYPAVPTMSFASPLK